VVNHNRVSSRGRAGMAADKIFDIHFRVVPQCSSHFTVTMVPAFLLANIIIMYKLATLGHGEGTYVLYT
jgi:hypothetical protein